MTFLEQALQHEIKPALGCTEPVAIAIAARHAALQAGDPIDSLEITLSTNLFKNALEVGIPGTGGERGIPLAAALGCVIPLTTPSLTILEHVTPELLEKARAMVARRAVKLSLAHDRRGVFIDACAHGRSIGRAVIEDAHENLVLLTRNGEVQFQQASRESQPDSGEQHLRARLSAMSIADLLQDLPHLSEAFRAFLLDGITMNRRVADAGLNGSGVLKIGNAYQQLLQEGWLQADLLTKAKIITSAAVDARMSGCPLPVMTSAGSGNQGLAITLPLWSLAEHLKADSKQLAEALALAHAFTAILKYHTGTLSAMCGCVVCAGIGLSAGATRLMGGSIEAMSAAVNHMVGSITGIICDGAKVGCALKLVCGVDSALQAAMIACHGVTLPSTNGVLGDTIEESLRNVGRIAAPGMLPTDDQILEIMMGKPN